MQRGVRIGIDVGKSRIGLARTDPDATMALPVATVAMTDTAVQEISRTIAEYEPIVIYVGLPLSLNAEHTQSTQFAIDFAQQLAHISEAPVRLVDERLSTVSAASTLRATGHTAQSSKGIIDQAAAVVILEHALDVEAKQNTFAGQPVGE